MRVITIGENQYPCRVTMGAMVRFKNESGKDISKMEPDDVSDLVLFLFCCIKSACAADGVAFAFSFEEFADMIGPEELQGFTAEMASSEQKKTKE